MQRKRTATSLASLLVITGALITLENFSVIQGVSWHWPLLLLILGAGFVLLFFQRDRLDPVLLWLGTFIFVLGVLFYYLNGTSWSQLASLWPVFLGIVGLSFLSVAVLTRRYLFAYFASGFIALFIIFTLIFNISRKLWPMSFVVFGIGLLILDHQQRNRG